MCSVVCLVGSVDCVAESKLELLGRCRRVEVMNARVGHALVLEAAGLSERHEGGRGRGAAPLRGGGATRPVCTAPLPHSLMQKRAQTSGVHFQRLCALYSMLRRASLCNAEP